MTTITQTIAAKVLEVVDCGLVKGLGKPIPGMMCVEAAVCYALGEPHSDAPSCVSEAIRTLKIVLNDSIWSSSAARAKGMRRLAIAQLGSNQTIDDTEFAKRVVEMTIRKMLPIALRVTASIQKDYSDALLAAATNCEVEGTRASALAAREVAKAARDNADGSDAAADASYSAFAAYHAASDDISAHYAAAQTADAAHAAATAVAVATNGKRDGVLAEFAEAVVQILIEMKAPGVEWLYLTDGVAA